MILVDDGHVLDVGGDDDEDDYDDDVLRKSCRQFGLHKEICR